MRGMFRGAEKINQDIRQGNTSKVAYMRETFFRAAEFNQDRGRWNTSKVTNMGVMFKGIIKFNQDIWQWNTSHVTTMRGMFEGAEKFNWERALTRASYGILHIFLRALRESTVTMVIPSSSKTPARIIYNLRLSGLMAAANGFLCLSLQDVA